MKSSRPSVYPWVLLGLLTAFWGMVGLNRVGISYLFPILNDVFDLAYWQTGLLVSGTSFTWAFASWGSGWLGDRYGRRKVLLPGAALACAATAAMGGAWNFISLFIIRDFVGLGDGVGWPNAQSTIGREFGERSRAFASSVFTSGSAVAMCARPSTVSATVTVTPKRSAESRAATRRAVGASIDGARQAAASYLAGCHLGACRG